MVSENYFRHDHEFYCGPQHNSIYGVVWLPTAAATEEKTDCTVADNTERFPLIIFCHELGLNHRSAAPWAQHFTRLGYAVAACDFRGGSVRPNKSDGNSRYMSVLSEVADLTEVLNAACGWDFVDASRIIVCGASQGGIVAALTAHAQPTRIKALMLLYPAFSVSDGMRRMFPKLSDVPSEFNLLGWMPVGSRYVTDMWSYEPFEHIADFEGPVLIIHGEDDPIVSVSYARRAAEVYRNCELHVLSGEGHGFTEDAFETSCKLMGEFLLNCATKVSK